ncbi:MAG: hypothetical protein WC564_03230 [Patescibacteria group bacterium]
MLTQTEGIFLILLLWIIAFVGILFWTKKQKNSASSFLTSNRNVGLLLGTLSVAVAWIWAPALFVASQKAYEQGIAGLFWFTLPNALALVLFSFLAVKMKAIFSEGYTLPEYINKKFGQRLQIVFLASIFIIQIYAVIVQLTGALLVLNLTTGISKQILILLLGAVILSISLLKGMKSSLLTDVIKALMISSIVFVIIPIIFSKIGGWLAISPGLGGISGKFTNIFDPKIMWTFGLPITISLFSGIVVDQQQWQRAFSIKSQSVKKSFLIGSLIFVLIPLALGSLGLIAANKSLGIIVSQSQLAGFSVIQNFLPRTGLIVFIMMVLAALVASGSAALSAAGSLGSIDLYKIFKKDKFEKLDGEKRDKKIIKIARWTMVVIIVIAMSIALVPNIQILYLQLLIGAFRSALIIPTILALFWSRLQEKPTFWGILIGMAIGVPLFIYGSIYKIPSISSFGALLPIIITAIFCYFGSFRKKLESVTISESL